MGNGYVIEVVQHDTNEVVKRLEANGWRAAERIERGLLINMNRERYFVRLTAKGTEVKNEPQENFNTTST